VGFVGSAGGKLKVIGTRLYEAHAGGMAMYDVQNPAQPQRLGEYAAAGENQYFSVDGHRLYLATGTLMHVVDVSNPAAPQKTGEFSWNPRGEFETFTSSRDSHYLYEMVNSSGANRAYGYILTHFLNDAGIPTGEGRDTQITSSLVWNVRRVNNYLFINSADRLSIASLETPFQPTVEAVYPAKQYHSVAVEGGFMHLLGGDVLSFKVDLPTDPKKLATLKALGSPITTPLPYAQALYKRDGVLFVAGGEQGVVAVDVRDEQAPAILSTFSYPYGYVDHVFGKGAYVYASTAQGISVLNGCEPSNMSQVLKVRKATTDRYRDLSKNFSLIDGDYAYIAENSSHSPQSEIYNPMRIIDTRNKTNPIEVGWLNVKSSAAVVKRDGFLFSAVSYGMQIIDVRDPKHPQLTAELKLDNPKNDPWAKTRGVAVYGNYAYLGDDNAGVIVVDITDLTAPKVVTQFASSPVGEQVKLTVHGHYLYVATATSGVQVLDLQQSVTNPPVVSSLKTSYVPYHVLVEGANMYVADGYGGVVVAKDANAKPPAEQTPTQSPKGEHQVLLPLVTKCD